MLPIIWKIVGAVLVCSGVLLAMLSFGAMHRAKNSNARATHMKARFAACISLLAFGILSIITGCNRHVVYVMDESGRPLQGVMVYAVAPSLAGPSSHTDAKGRAVVAETIQRPYWLRLNKPDYGSRDLDWPSQWPARVIFVRGSDADDIVSSRSRTQPQASTTASD